MICICHKFNLSTVEPIEVREADDNLLMTEARDIMSKAPADWSGSWTTKTKVLETRIEPWVPQLAKQEFLKEYQNWRT